MYFQSLNQFLHMGGYAHYVWPAYGIASVVIISNILAAFYQKKRVVKSLQQYYKRESLNRESLNNAS